MLSVLAREEGLTFHPGSGSELRTTNQTDNIDLRILTFVKETSFKVAKLLKPKSEALGKHFCHDFGKASE